MKLLERLRRLMRIEIEQANSKQTNIYSQARALEENIARADRIGDEDHYQFCQEQYRILTGRYFHGTNNFGDGDGN